MQDISVVDKGITNKRKILSGERRSELNSKARILHNINNGCTNYGPSGRCSTIALAKALKQGKGRCSVGIIQDTICSPNFVVGQLKVLKHTMDCGPKDSLLLHA